MFSAKIIKEASDGVVVELSATEDGDMGGQLAHPFDGVVALQFEPPRGASREVFQARKWRVSDEDAGVVQVVCEAVPGGGKRDAQALLFIRPQVDAEPAAQEPPRVAPKASVGPKARKKTAASRPGAKVQNTGGR